MKKYLIGFAVLVIVASCQKEKTEKTDPHVAGALCASCHTTEQSQWASAKNLHALSASDVLTNVDHNTAELLNDDCLKCHSTFQYSLGVAHFVTPVNQTGSPAGTWTAQNGTEWQATKCEVCHDPTLTTKAKLAKYGSVLDGQWSASYINLSTLPAAYQKLLNLTTGDTSTYVFTDQTSFSALVTKLCSSCHDPADQGGDPEVIVGGISYGPQGGDSRAYVATNHQGFGCIDCHNPHDFMPVDPKTTLACSTCHSGTQTGKVHMNHI
jgi:hypothetical protein